jgi:hypothetical protein
MSISTRAAIDLSRQAAAFFLQRLRREVSRLCNVTYPGHHPGPKKWLDVVTGVLDTAVGYLATAADPTTSDDDASQYIADAEALGSEAYDMLRELDGADADQIPHQIVKPFQRWVDGLGISNTIFFRADHVANYELARFHLDGSLYNVNDPAPSLMDALQAVEWPFMRLTVPSEALGMLPHFAIVGHELGHAIQDKIVLPSATLDLSPFYSALDARLNKEGMVRTTDTDLMAWQVLDSWAQEFKSDAVGLLVAGPAFFFALGGFFEIAGGGYGISPSHPPSELRRQLVLAGLRTGSPSHSEVFEAVAALRIEEDINSPHVARLPDDDTLFSSLKTKYGPEHAAICVALLTIAKPMGAALFAEAEVVLKRDSAAMLYGPNRLRADLEDHLEPLCALIPPIERRDGATVEATSLAGNLNVGWAALLTRLDRIKVDTGSSGDPDTPKMEKLHELLLKGVELAEARMTWDECP